MKENNFRDELREVINKHCKENGSNTPDFVLAEYLDNCLKVFDLAIKSRENWYGKELNPPGLSNEYK